MLLTGGESTTYQSTELFPPVPGCTTPQLPAYRRAHSTFLTDDLVLASCGGTGKSTGKGKGKGKGKGGSNYISDCLILNPVSMQWQTDTSVLGHLPEKRAQAADVTVAGVGTYLLGGHDGFSRYSSSAFLPTGSSTWQSGPSLSQGMIGACAFSYKKSYFVTGGMSFSGRKREVREYSTESWQWLPAPTWPSLQSARRDHGCAVLGSTAVIAGGRDGEYLASTELYDLDRKTRNPGGTLQLARYLHLVTVGPSSHLRILAFGDDLVEEWQEESGTWKEAGRLEESRKSYTNGAVAVPKGLVCKKEN